MARKCVFLIFVHESVSSLIPCSELNTEVCHLSVFRFCTECCLSGLLEHGVVSLLIFARSCVAPPRGQPVEAGTELCLAGVAALSCVVLA